jgi:hypothetical protein
VHFKSYNKFIHSTTCRRDHRTSAIRLEARKKLVTSLLVLGQRLNSLGCGDVFAGTVTFLLGQPRKLVSGELVRVALQFAEEVAAVHISGSEYGREQNYGESSGISNGLIRPENTAFPNRCGVWKFGTAVSARDHWLYCRLVWPPWRLRFMFQ